MNTSPDKGLSHETMIRLDERRREAQARHEERLASFTGECVTCWDDPGIACRDCERGRALIDQQQIARRRDTLAEAGVPLRFLDHTFESYPHEGKQPVQDAVVAWDGRSNMLIVGPYGVGKTGLIVPAIAAVLDRLMIAGQIPVMFTSGVALTDALRAGYSDGTFQQTMDRAKCARLLVIDDLGAEKSSEWVQERLFAIVDERYGNLRPTWATTNLHPDRLAERIGERTMWRLIEEGPLILLTGPNLRERKVLDASE